MEFSQSDYGWRRFRSRTKRTDDRRSFRNRIARAWKTSTGSHSGESIKSILVPENGNDASEVDVRATGHTIDTNSSEQQPACETILAGVRLRSGKIFFLEPEKTFLTDSLVTKLRSEGITAIAVASSCSTNLLLYAGKRFDGFVCCLENRPFLEPRWWCTR